MWENLYENLRNDTEIRELIRRGNENLGVLGYTDHSEAHTALVAEKTAQANVISRREEVASTRSLLNTAKLMDENTTLYKLKELEYLERICGKVGEISVNGNAGIVEQLGKIMGFGQAV